jgi:GntR family transcriptional regulator, transcriptional repressor for pyruvate dehydrogenase complex
MTIYPRIKSKSIFEQIISYIQEQLSEGKLKTNDQLPPERELAQLMGVNRHSVREAFRVLEFAGVIERKTGVGTVIKSIGPDILVERLRYATEFSPKNFLEELLELRMAIEPMMASLAAKRATKSEIREMDSAIEELKQQVIEGSKSGDADIRLHLAIAKAAHNTTFFKIAEPVFAMLFQYRERSKRIINRDRSIVVEHQQIVSAIKNRDHSEARSAMKYHLKQVKKVLLIN